MKIVLAYLAKASPVLVNACFVTGVCEPVLPLDFLGHARDATDEATQVFARSVLQVLLCEVDVGLP